MHHFVLKLSLKLLFVGTTLAVLGCQTQQAKNSQPTVRIPPKVEKKAEPEKPKNLLVGTWKSNRELTWASVNSIEGISKESVEYLQKNVFGILTREFTETHMRTFFGQVALKDEKDSFNPYSILDQNENHYKVRYVDEASGKPVNATFYWENDCYYELVSEWQYKEYYCRVESSKKKFIAVPKSFERKQ